MQVEELTSDAELSGLAPEWERLWERQPSAGPFQHPDWLVPWRRWFGRAPLWTLAARDGGRLVGLAPFFLHLDPRSGRRQLTLVGNGVSDRLDILVDPDADGAGDALLERVLQRRDRWDFADLRDLPPASPLLRLARAQGFDGAIEPDAPCPTLDLTGAAPDLKGCTSAGLLANLRTARRRAERLGPVRLETLGAEALDAGLDALERLHAARWRGRGEGGVLAGTSGFHREAAARFMAKGWLRLHVLRLDGDIVAASYGFAVRGRAYYYLGGFDPAFERISPGGLAIEFAVGQAVREGASEFDFLRGREAYKYAWGAVDQPQFRVRLAQSLRCASGAA